MRSQPANWDTTRMEWLESTRGQVIWVRESQVDVWVVLSKDGITLAKDQHIRTAIDSAMRATAAIEKIISQTPRVE